MLYLYAGHLSLHSHEVNTTAAFIKVESTYLEIALFFRAEHANDTHEYWSRCNQFTYVN